MAAGAGVGAQEASAPPELQPVIVQATALPGTAIDADKVPGNVQTLRAADLARDGAASLTRALGEQLGSVNFSDNLDDPNQPDILYRGFAASPVLGTPQGLAVYQNGVRINEAFGDTVNWDLFPDIAIERVDIVSASPVYGLNALGGAVSVQMKNGFSERGAQAEASAGSFGQRAAVVEAGAGTDAVGFYGAGRISNEEGWRVLSGDALRQLYAAASARAGRASLDLSYAHADNVLNGQGSAPVQELAVNRSFAFTGPQSYTDRLDFVTINAGIELADARSLQALAYYRQFGQGVANGNTTDYVACTMPAGRMCQPDGVTPLTDGAGVSIPDISHGGTRPIGENDLESIGAYGRGAALQFTDAQGVGGHGNHLTAGASLDAADATFASWARLGVIGPLLTVEPSSWVVDTPEGTPFDATPIQVRAANRAVGAYATDTLDLSEQLAVTAGARWNLATIDLRDERGGALDGDNRYAHVNPALGATFKLSPALGAYAGVSENTRTPTASEIECSNPQQPCLLPSNLASDPPSLRQVVARAVEAGLRGAVAAGGTAISWNAGAFRTEVDDDIYGVATSLSSGYFQNIGGTRRQGLEAALRAKAPAWTAFASASLVDATFRSPLLLPSPQNPYADANGDIRVAPGDHLPGVARERLKAGLDWQGAPGLTLGASVAVTSGFYYFGDEANRMAPLPGYSVVGLHGKYRVDRQVEIFAGIDNLFDVRYATYGILGDPTGVGAPGIAPGAVTNGPGVDNRFQSPAAPFAAFAGVRVKI